jgi:hypothetical protein
MFASNGLMRWLGVLVFCVTCSSETAAEHVLWLETERFDSSGGWTSDTQFIDQMGSPYLMAIGLGKPVADAVTTVSLPQTGRYRLWARTRDWVPQHHPGRFQICLNGQTIEPVLGQSGQAGWHWENGGVHALTGRIELRLHDLTGYYGRCDVVVLTDNLTWIPPDEKDQLAKLRAIHGGVSGDVKDMGQYDVVVAGGGLAGCMAAVASARLGAKTVLVQDRPVLGGNGSVEILVPPVGFWPHTNVDPLDPRETGLIEEVRGLGNQRTDEAKLYSGRLLRLVAAEPNLTLHLNTRVTGVEPQSPSVIRAVTALDTRNGQRLRFGGRVFVDCTGDSVVGVAAGGEYRHGREPRAMYGESMAPEVGDGKTMGNSLKYFSQPTDAPQPFESVPWAMEFDRCEDFTPGRHPRLSREIEWQWMIELGGTQDTYRDAEEIRDDLLRLMYGMWDHLKNHCPKYRDQAANHKLVWMAHVAGKRENRRLIGDYVLTQNDIAQQTLFADRVAYGGWGVDDHYPEGFFYNGPPAQHDYKAWPHSIPYRSLYSKNVDNLLMAGRNVSASHVAMSATRVMLTCAVMGQAAGTAAAMCVEHRTTPRGLYQSPKHLEELQQQLLKDGAHLIDLANRDPRDLARAATATASSQRTRSTGEVMRATNAINGFARAAAGKTNAWGPEATDAQPWLELAWDEPKTFNLVHVTFLTAAHSPRRFALQVWQRGVWQNVAEVDANRFRRHLVGLDRQTTARLRIVFLEPQGPEPGICEIRVYDEPERLVEIARRAAKNMRLPDGGPGLPWDESVVWGTGVDPKKLAGVILDDTQAETTGSWTHSEYSQPFVGNGYVHDGNANKGAKSLAFVPTIPKAGKYEVRIAYLATPNRATNTPVTIQTGEISQTVQVNQRRKPAIDGLFEPLGTFLLPAGKSTRIVVGNAGTDGYAVVDAIQLVPVDDK